MDALMSSAQIWVPWLGVACLALGKGLLAWLGRAGGARAPTGSAIPGYYLSFGLAVIAPLLGALLAWMLQGGLCLFGPILVLMEPAAAAQQLTLAAWLAAPVVVFLLARYIGNSADAVAYGVAAAMAITASTVFPPLTVLAIALAAGGLGGFVAVALGDAAFALAACTGFVLLFGFAYAGGGQAIANLTLALIGGLVLSLFAASGKRARLPLFLLLPILPALALSWLDGSASMIDLGATLPKPATGTEGALVLMFALAPALAAPIIWPIAIIARRSSAPRALLFAIAEPFAILGEIVLGLLLAGLLALMLSAGAALYSHLHVEGGGQSLVRVASIVQGIAPGAPGESWWLMGLLALPLVPALIHLIAYVTRLFVKLLDIAGISTGAKRMMEGLRAADRLVTRLAFRLVQLAPALAIGFLVLRLAPIAYALAAGRVAMIAERLGRACVALAAAIELWPGP